MNTLFTTWIRGLGFKNTVAGYITGKWSLFLLALFVPVLWLDITNAAVTSYEYDQFGQLSTAQYADGTTQEYTYDAIGNRLQYKVLPSLLGDVDGDHTVSLGDAILVLKICAGETDVPHVNKNADIDSSSNIGIAEAIYVLRKVTSQ